MSTFNHSTDNTIKNVKFTVLSQNTGKAVSTVLNPIFTKRNLFPVVFLFITLLLLLSAKIGFAQSGATISASGSTQICSGNSVLLTINDAPAGASFQWMRNNSEISGAISESFAATQAGTYTAILIFNNQKDTLNNVQINKRADASLNGSGATTINGQPYFKICASAASSFDFTNASTTSTSNTRYIIKWGDGTPNYESATFNTKVSHLFPVGTRKMTFIVYAGACVDSTEYTVFVGNIPAGGLVGVGGSTICTENEQKFVIAGTKNNPPGTMYIMFYNDGSKRDTFYHPAPDTVSHIFRKSSCGTNSSNGTQSFPNSYGAFLSIVNPCGSAGGSILPIYVSDKPKAEFTVSPSDTSCVNQILTITNSTKLMNNVENGTCKTMKYVWRITSLTPGGAWTLTSGTLGNDFGSNDPNIWTAGTLSIKPRFTVVGTYSVKLIMINSTLCGADSIEKIICINPLPTASFTTDVTSGCAPLTVKADASTNTPLCGQNQFNWSVVYAATPGCRPTTSSFTYVNGTNSKSQNPQIRFDNPGVYKLRLQVMAPDSGCTSAVREIEIIVKGKPVVTLTAPDQICLNEKVRPSVSATCYATSATYQWTFTGANNESFSGIIPDSVAYPAAGTYTIKVGATNECGTTDSVRQLIVKHTPVMTQPADIIVCSGQQVNIPSFASSLANTVFNWTNNQVSVGLAASGTGNIASFKALNTTTAPVVATIRVTPVLNGCSGEVREFTITVKPLPATPTVSNIAYCQFDAATPLEALAVNGNALRWYDVSNGGNFSLLAPTPSTSMSGTKIFYVSQFNPTSGCESPRAAIEVRVKPKPSVQNISREVCNNEAFEITPVSSVSGSTYSWTIPELTKGLSGASAGTNQMTVKGKLENSTIANQTAVYSITPSAENCNGNVFNLTVVVKPSAEIKNKQLTICSGSNFSVKPLDGENNDRVPVGTEYTWNTPIVTPAGAIAGVLPSPSSQNQISQSLFNISSKNATVTYTVAPKSGVANACVGDSFLIAVTVTPVAKIQKQTVTICSRTAFDVKPVDKADGNVVPENTKYFWSAPVVTPAGSVTGGLAQLVPQSSISQRLENNTSSTAMVVYKVTPVTGTIPSCEGDVFEVVVYVNPQVGIADQNAEICSGDIFSVIPTGTPVYTTYTWSNPVSNPAGAIAGGFAQSIPQKAISQELNNLTNQVATLTYTISPKTANCTDASFKIDVKVFPKPVVRDTTIEICTQTAIQYKPENNIAGAIVPENTTYTWSNPVITPAGAISGFSSQAVPQNAFAQTLINNTTEAATITYTLVAYSGAEGKCISKAFKLTLVVRPNAKAVMNFPKNIDCAPFVLNTTNLLNASPATASNQYKWFINGQIAGTQRDFPGYVIPKVNDSVLVQLIAISDYGCKNDTTINTFYTSPLPNASFSTSVDTVCGPATIAIKNLSVSSNTLAYRWDFGNSQFASIYQPDSIKYRSALSYGDTTYTIKLSVISACETVTFSKNIVVRSAPKASFIPNRVSGCSPVEVLFTNLSQGVNNIYEWNFGDGTTNAVRNISDTITHMYNTGLVSTFNAVLTARNHCGTDQVSIPMFIRPNLIKLDVLTDGNFTKGCAPLRVKFINQSSGSSSYKWDFGDGNILIRTSGKDTIYHSFSAPGKYDVRVFSSNGCSDTSAYVTSVQTFETPSSVFTADKYTACKGDTIRFTNESAGATNYKWIFGNGSSSIFENPAQVFKAGGSYDVNLIAIKQHTPGVSCSDTSSQKILISDTSVSNFNLSNNRGSCLPFVVGFQQPLSSVSGVNWDFGDGTNSSELNPSHSYTKNGSYQARMVVKSNSGCVYTAAKTITVAAPEGTAKMKSGFHCMEAPVQMTATAFNTDSIVWNFGDGKIEITGNVGSVYHNYSNPGVYVPKVSFKNTAGCLQEVKLSDTIRVENIKVGFKALMQKSCGYTDVQFVDTTLSQYGVNQIKWSFGNGATASGSSATQRYTVSGNYQIKIEALGVAGCKGETTYPLAVEVYKKPQANIVSNNSSCTDLVTNFKSSSQSVDPINYYNWKISNGYTIGTEQMNYRFAAPGTYQITLIAGTANQCFDTARMDVQVLQAPNINVSNDATICREKSITLQAAGAVSYNWYPVEGLNCTTCATPVARPYATTQYVVKGVGANGCYRFDTVTVNVKQPFKISVSKSDSICIGKSIQLSASGAESYSWLPATGLSNPLSGTPVATPTISTTYRVIGKDNQCFTDTAYIRIGVGNIPSIELGEDQILNTGTPFKIKPVVTNGPVKTWSWTPANDLSCSDCAEPLASPGNNITYTATATTNYGCVVKDTISFKVFCENSQVFIPNGFTPDGDGINDMLMVRARGISKVRYFRIFNRWGEMVFERYNFQPNDPSNGWDGKFKGQESGPAVYVYMLEVECSNGTPFTYKGNITIIK